jgi:CheY-like chemotaxis protein
MNCAQTTRDGRDLNARRRTTGAGGSRTTALGLAALVVDDDPITLKLVAAMLEKIGFNVRTSCGGVQALLDFGRTPCDLVLTDFQMPIINGYQLGCKIKSRQPGTHVVIMTGLSRAAVAGLMGDGCIDGWLFKPFFLDELKILMERVRLSAKSCF